MKINNKIYDILKYLAQVGLPALATFVFAVGPVWDMPRVDEVAATIIATNTLLGALLVINQVRYNNSDVRFDGSLIVEQTPPNVDNEIRHLDITDSVNDITDKGEVLLKVRPEDYFPPAA